MLSPHCRHGGGRSHSRVTAFLLLNLPNTLIHSSKLRLNSHRRRDEMSRLVVMRSIARPSRPPWSGIYRVLCISNFIYVIFAKTSKLEIMGDAMRRSALSLGQCGLSLDVPLVVMRISEISYLSTFY